MLSPKLLVTNYLTQHGYGEYIQYLEYPVDPMMGDVAFPCFHLSREMKQSPAQITTEIKLKLQPDVSISHIEAVGPYVNFFINWDQQAKDLFNDMISTKIINNSVYPIDNDAYGIGEQKNEKILVESPGPNTNKPLHLGHVRNMLLGNALAKILSFVGYDVKKVDIINDRGVHICKSMLAYQKSAFRDQTPESLGVKSDHFVGQCYVAYDKGVKEDHPEREQEIQEMLVKREGGNQEVRTLWQKMKEWAIIGQSETYKRYGTNIDKAYFESDGYVLGKFFVAQGVKDGVFYKNEKGNIVADLMEEMGQEKTVLRADGTSIYITQDLALGKLRYEDFCMDRMIYVVGNEQEDHFKALFYLFKKLGFGFADRCFHLSYGMIELPDGKMKSREGNVVDADTLADEMHERVVELLTQRYPDLDATELHRRAEIIAMAAIKFFILKYDAKKGFIFDREHSLDFAGETGPYILYTYARISGILDKGFTVPMNLSDLDDYSRSTDERIILTKLMKFPEIVEQSATQYAPSIIARYLLELASLFNSYYVSADSFTEKNNDGLIVAKSSGEAILRSMMLRSVGVVIKNGLSLLGIDQVLEKM